MKQTDVEKKIIENYQRDENSMILVFAQWCINHDLDPKELYEKAYPNQAMNQALLQTLDLTVSKEEAGEIAHETLLGVLTLFGNNDLALVVSEEIALRKL
ncbi:hypothetical protein WAK64_07940 [Bacillus spongiae]|uniref:DUF3243 domain-containing protein n=1 Tax=Bacillus spongiae TaxID=2683610 RepID=A0ABU8HCS3_9BACI